MNTKPSLFPQTVQQRMLALMVERFPKCFFPIHEAPKPLKVGIKFDLSVPLQNELKEEQFRKDLWTFFKWYVRRKPYQEALCADNAKRVDLEGNEMMVIIEHHQKCAKAKLDKIIKADEARRLFAKSKEVPKASATSEEVPKAVATPEPKSLKKSTEPVVPVRNLNVLKPKLTLKKKVSSIAGA